MNNIYKRIYRTIKKYNTIVIARHIGPDPDALASSLALKDIILNKFPKKNVYTVGASANKFKYLGLLDKLPENLENALLIVTDIPDAKRIDGANYKDFAYRIKIDHHPFVESFCEIEWIDDKASSASQMVMELVFNTPFKFTKEIAEKLYTGLVADTNRFLYSYTTEKTFALVSKLLKEQKIDTDKIYNNLYMRPIKELRFQGYISENLKLTLNGVGHLLITEDKMHEYNIDVATAGNMINNFNYIDEILVWVLFSIDSINNNIRVSIRSRGPVINTVAQSFGGGGHAYASGIKVKTYEETEAIVEALDKVCKEYKEGKER